MAEDLQQLHKQIQTCTLCASDFDHTPRPVLQVCADAKILIAGQAPGRKVHESGIPFDDPSGDKLRDWLGVSREQFYNPKLFAIVPMAFCFPGTGKSGDLAPPPICAQTWREQLLQKMPNIELTLVIGSYAQSYHLPDRPKTLTDTVKAWQEYWPEVLPLPHPSPRNFRWFKANPWFETELLPPLRQSIVRLLTT